MYDMCLDLPSCTWLIHHSLRPCYNVSSTLPRAANDSSFNGGLYLEMIQEKKDEKDVSLKRLQTGVDKIDEAEFGAGPVPSQVSIRFLSVGNLHMERSTIPDRPTDADQFSLYICVSL